MALIALFTCFELTDLDRWFQDHFFDFATGIWWGEAKAPAPLALFYNGPNCVVSLTGLTVLVLAQACA